jgi:hypothetical protein
LFEYDYRRFAVLSTLIRQPNGSDDRLVLNRKRALQIVGLDRPLSVALENDELNHLAEPAEKPDEKDDREWYADQPEQKTSTHSLSPPIRLLPTNVAPGFKFQSRQQSGRWDLV